MSLTTLCMMGGPQTLPVPPQSSCGIVDFRFHDLRHCAINNLRLAGNDHFSIKKVSGHKTDIAFQRYNLVTEEEMLGMKWLDLKKDEHRTMDTYMDTKAL